MNETTTKPEVITDAHLAVLNAARTALEEISHAADSAAWNAPTQASEGGPFAQWYGKVSALAERCEDAIFDLLNTAQATKVADIQDDRLYNRQPVLAEVKQLHPEPDGQRMEGGRWVPTDR